MNTVVVSFPHPRSRARQRSRIDRASVALLRVVMADEWDADSAAHDLLSRIHGDRGLIRVLRARVARAMLAHPTDLDRRALETLDRALTIAPEPRS